MHESHGHEDLYKRCDRCDGQGKYVGLVTVENPCKGCEGKGKIANPEAVKRVASEIIRGALKCWGVANDSVSRATEATKAFSAKLSDTCANEKASDERSYPVSHIEGPSCVTNVSPEEMEDYVTGLRKALARWRSERYPDAVCIPAPSENPTLSREIPSKVVFPAKFTSMLRELDANSLFADVTATEMVRAQPMFEDGDERSYLNTVKFYRVESELFEIKESVGSDE